MDELVTRALLPDNRLLDLPNATNLLLCVAHKRLQCIEISYWTVALWY